MSAELHRTNDERYDMLSKEEMANPNLVIVGFFSFIALAQARGYITGMLKAAFSGDYWKERSPGSLLFFHQNLVRLIEGTHVIISNKEQFMGQDAIPPSVYRHAVNQSIIDPLYYAGWQSDSTAWDFFPRYITKNEFARPYSVFFKFFRYYNLQEWKEELEDILFHALSKGSVLDTSSGSDLLTIHIYLQKLIEAAHLIEVRELHKAKNTKKTVSKK